MKRTLDAVDFERVDRLARRLYGTERGGNAELVLEANQGLAALALRRFGFLPRGTAIDVPLPPPVKPNPALTRPWE